MSKIVVKIAEPVPANRSIARIRAITGQSMAEVMGALSGAKILGEFTVFLNDHEECAEKLLGVLKVLDDNQVGYRLYELNPEHTADASSLPPQHKISGEVLQNILQAHQKRLASL